MITRAKLVEQLREHQIRSAKSYSAALAVFSPNPHISSRMKDSEKHPESSVVHIIESGICNLQILDDFEVQYALGICNSETSSFAFWRDLKVALLYAVLFCFLMVSCYVALYLKWFKLSSLFVFFGILLPIGLKISRHRRLKRKRERRLLLPLSM